MSAFRQTLKKILPAGLLQMGGQAWDALGRAGEWPAALLHPARRDTRRRLAQLKDIHRGQRCFIIGNGPSLRNTDLSRLRAEYTIGMNRIYLAFPEWGFQTSYYLSVNDLVKIGRAHV